MIFPENRRTPRIEYGAGFFRIMREGSHDPSVGAPQL